MTQEEKAKAYDEALLRAKNLHKDAIDLGEDIRAKQYEIIFPELKESEDEKIRKAIYNAIKYLETEHSWDFLDDVDILDAYTWLLEKQCKQKTIWHNEDEEPKIGSLILLIMQSGKPIVAKIIEPNHTFNHGERWAYIDDLLEKQSENSIFNVPSREVILAIWDLGNEWKELTNGCISTEYGTQLDYIQKHWEESEYYLREKQNVFNKKDVDDAYLKGITDAKNEIEKQYEANYQIRKDIATFLFNYKGDIKDRSKWMNYLGIKVSFVEKQGEKPQGKSALEAIKEEKVDSQNCVKSIANDTTRLNIY